MKANTWEDTVMGDNMRVTIIDNSSTFEILSINIAKDQAEITWDIAFMEGLKEGIKDKADFGLAVHEAAILIGIKEVAEWVEKQWSNWPNSAFLLQEYDWQAFKKEKGL